LIEAGSLFPFQLRHESNGISIINISNFSISVEEVGKGRDGKERWERKGRKGGKGRGSKQERTFLRGETV
jgi:hypothetical protein